MNYTYRHYKTNKELDRWLWKHPKVKLVSVLYDPSDRVIYPLTAWLAYDEEDDIYTLGD